MGSLGSQRGFGSLDRLTLGYYYSNMSLSPFEHIVDLRVYSSKARLADARGIM